MEQGKQRERARERDARHVEKKGMRQRKTASVVHLVIFRGRTHHGPVTSRRHKRIVQPMRNPQGRKKITAETRKLNVAIHTAKYVSAQRMMFFTIRSFRTASPSYKK
jgi:hypothetical protein